MYISISLKELFFKKTQKSSAVLIYDNQVVITKNIPNSYIGYTKTALLAHHPETEIININKFELWSTIIEPLQKFANDLPNMYFLPDLPGILPFTSIHLTLDPYIRYFGSLKKFRDFLDTIMLKQFNTKLNYVISPNPFANTLICLLNDENKIFIDKSYIQEIRNIPISSCFFICKKDVLNLQHLRVYSIGDIIKEFDLKDLKALLTKDTANFLNNLCSLKNEFRLVKITPIDTVYYNLNYQINEQNVLAESIFNGLNRLSIKLQEKNLTLKNALILFQSQESIKTFKISFSKDSKEAKSLCNKVASTVPLPIISYCIIPTEIKKPQQLTFFKINDETNGILEKAITSNYITPELCYKYVKSNEYPKNLNLDFKSDIPPFLISPPIKIDIFGVLNCAPRYIVFKNKKIKILKSQIHSLIFPEWWNIDTKDELFKSKKRLYYKLLTENGLILWVAIIDNNGFLNGIWS